MTRFISTYLLQHKSLSIPGLGTIYVERIPAQSDFVNKQLLEPSYHYRFDKYVDVPSKEFFRYLSVKQNSTDSEAATYYQKWAMSLKNSITISRPAVLEGVGELKKNISGEILFEPYSKIKTFDTPVHAERVIRSNARHTMLVGDRETTTAEMTGYLHKTHKEKASWWIYALIISAIALVAIFYHYFRNGSDAPFGNHQTIRVK